ncbi:MAG: hypothetical protein HY870_11735, partial [Chloroflexi bacterium]|nr:hypothetical protein [Chloroflexota bacterium]
GLLALAAPVAEFIAQFNRERPPVTRDKVRELSEHFWVTDPSRAKRDFGWEAQHDLLSGMRLTTRHFYEEQAQLRAMPLDTPRLRWLKYLTVASGLGILIELTSSLGKFYHFEPGWLVLVVIFGAFGLALGSLAMALRTRSVAVQFLTGSVLAGAAELLNALNLSPNFKWVFAPDWPFGITDPIGRALVLGLAGGAFIVIVNALLLTLYKRRLRLG